MLLAGLGLCLGFPVETCDGKSAGLTPAQCNAWIDLFDAANGDDWFDCERTRTDPCSCNVGTESNSVCDEAFTVIANLVLPFNNMVGSLPASLSALVNVTMLDVQDNHLVGPLPSLPWASMDLHLGDNRYCQLYGKGLTGVRQNAFDCPLPAAVLKLPCFKFGDQTPVTATDCGPPPAPPPPRAKYKCESNKCTKGAKGVSLKKCQDACGPVLAGILNAEAVSWG
jgi:hypothetical protein